MQHLDPGTLSMAALDEPLDTDSQVHLDGCDACASEVRELNGVVLAARGDITAAPLESPDSQVWAAIHQELGLQPALSTDPLTSPSPVQDTAPVSELSQLRAEKRTFTPKFLIAAVAAGVLTGAGAVWAVQQVRAEAAPDIVAQSQLDPLAGFTAGGSASVSTSDDGVRTLQITVTEDQADGYQEVWLIAPDLQQMYSLGVIGGGTSSLVIPDNVDLVAFPIVDVSDEPLDGDPLHSGVSVLRGTLEAEVG
ncbi:anti-sigma factor domain-containing protein [Arthrobacter sp. TMT4-20]